MLVSKIDTHVADGLTRLLHQYQDTPRVQALVATLVAEAQSLEDALFALDAGRQWANAEGAQLDGLGEIVGMPRNGAGDDAYRGLIAAAVARNNSDGTSAALVRSVAAAFGATAVFSKGANSIGASGVGSVVAFGVGSPTTNPDYYGQIETILANTLAASVSLMYLTTFDAGGTFAPKGPQDWVMGCSSLPDETPYVAGGALASVIYQNPQT